MLPVAFIFANEQAMAIDTGERNSPPLPHLMPIVEHAPLFAHAFEFAPVIVTIHEGPEHVVLYANAAARETAVRREYHELPLVAVFPEFEKWGVLARFDRAFTSGEVVRSGLYRMTEIGSANPQNGVYEQTIVPHFASSGEVLGVTAYTQRHAIADEAVHAN